MFHPDTVRITGDTHTDELLCEAANDRLARMLPRPQSRTRLVVSHVLRSLADALDPEYLSEPSRQPVGSALR